LVFLSSLYAEEPLIYSDPHPQSYHLSERASVIDPRCSSHPEINFVLEKDGKPTDVENADVDTRVKPRGQCVIWLMGYNPLLAERLNQYGLHAIQVAYAREWFNQFNTEPKDDSQHLGNIRCEVLTGLDTSKFVQIPLADSMQERAYQFIKYLAKKQPNARWDYFLKSDGTGLNWEKIIIAGSSHGATSSARFAIQQKVARVVMFCGPRDQLEDWQSLPSATPANRFFGYSHILDGGWTGNHYPRSWLLLGLNKFGPIINADTTPPPFGNSRRLTTQGDVKGDSAKAHGYVQPNKNSPKDKNGNYIQNELWKYLFTSDVNVVGTAVPPESSTPMDLRKK
jgi:hypothetical protein